ncbi:MAG TPA: UDP-N-acetylmuramoyl-tripeptide--D-alanyl-D-alanine ligase [Planctomycetes bacterium]|nr:UDP-N-acetylmuramoyl-tripeptide--D-alanyl-D-alanine ligase [Planctomycetota bacterium]HIK60033.1 UDP-N-acetylmuramoyl-tripeptide--D-alanyl-D-alanine ligase [Planctomycetota bacterium]
MNPFQLSDVLAACGGRLARDVRGTDMSGVSTDTRTLRQGELFVALSGPNHNGNDFASRAVQAGAAALVLQEGLESPAGEVPVVLCDDPRLALSRLAAWHRSRLQMPVVGITGSCGKTTTKNMLASLLSGHRRVLSSPASYNNDIGVPHTLFSAGASCETLVVEMGTNAPGEIEALCRTAQPTGGIVTNVGASHLAGLGSEAGVAREKGALPESIGPDGWIVLNADDAWSGPLRARTSARLLTFGIEHAADVRASELHFEGEQTTFQLDVPSAGISCRVQLPMLGQHNVANLLAALAACVGLGEDLDKVLKRVGTLRDGNGRMQRRQVGELTLIDDSYNANPHSARAAVCGLMSIPASRRVLVLGDMHELGELSVQAHRDLGKFVAEANVDLLVTIGTQALDIATGAGLAGMTTGRVRHFPSVERACEAIHELVGPGDVVLVKGSRAAGLEDLVQRILQVHGVEAHAY